MEPFSKQHTNLSKTNHLSSNNSIIGISSTNVCNSDNEDRSIILSSDDDNIGLLPNVFSHRKSLSTPYFDRSKLLKTKTIDKCKDNEIFSGRNTTMHKPVAISSLQKNKQILKSNSGSKLNIDCGSPSSLKKDHLMPSKSVIKDCVSKVPVLGSPQQIILCSSDSEDNSLILAFKKTYIDIQNCKSNNFFKDSYTEIIGENILISSPFKKHNLSRPDSNFPIVDTNSSRGNLTVHSIKSNTDSDCESVSDRNRPSLAKVNRLVYEKHLKTVDKTEAESDYISKLYNTVDSSSDDNFSTYIDKWKKQNMKVARKKLVKKKEKETFLIDDCESISKELHYNPGFKSPFSNKTSPNLVRLKQPSSVSSDLKIEAKSKNPKFQKSKLPLPAQQLTTIDSSSDDNFSTYINEWKKNKLNVTPKEEVRKNKENKIILIDNHVVNTGSDDKNSILTPIFNRNLPNANSWREQFSDSSDDNDIFKSKLKSKKKKIPTFKFQTPNITNTTKTKFIGPISFLASLSLEAPFINAHSEALPFLKNFRKQKELLSKKLFTYFNKHVFDNKLPHEMEIFWNVRLITTAGRCKCFKKKIPPMERSAKIELSIKVIDGPARLRDTLIHELCHAATWIFSDYSGHGKLWKAWAAKAMHTFPELPEISRCHKYKIQCKYSYRCVSCEYSYDRHSKSIDVENERCHCNGKLELIVNNRKKNSSSSVPRTPNAFAMFVKENYSSVRKSNMKHGDAMKELSKKFAGLKAFTLDPA